MALHVDVVENLWSAGKQRRVATAVLVNGRIEIEADAHWTSLVQTALDQREGSTPEQLLKQLADHFKSDYVHATRPHADACPFAHGEEVAFEGLEAPDRQAQPAGA
jgi:urate oxidase